VSVIGVVSRFLEHARIYNFHNAGEEEYYIGSADLMTRNLESRVELVVPIEDPALKKELNKFFEIQLEDTRSAWDMKADGEYIQRQPTGRGEAVKGCQQRLIEAAEKRQSEASRLRRRKPRAIAHRVLR
jgi:polyphosphate kinase